MIYIQYISLNEDVYYELFNINQYKICQ